jgi:diguanylate cyclase (GGDEF)-like protein
MIPLLPADEAARLNNLESYRILDTLPEQAYDDIVRLAAIICGTPMGFITMVDRERQWFKARLGVDVAETPRDISFCAHTLSHPDQVLTVGDARADSRFADNPLVTGEPHIRFYAGAPLVTPENHVLGALCVVDQVPRELSEAQREALTALSRQVVAQLEMRRQLEQLQNSERRLEAALARLEVLSSTDSLTGLYNRRTLDERLKAEFDRAQRYKLDLSFLMIDVDRFKQFNDRFGHPAGDDMLRQVAGALRQNARAQDVVARYGGEEFSMILPNTGREAALVIAERIRHLVAGLEGPTPVTVSIGISSLPGDVPEVVRMPDPQALATTADAALYQAKKDGRNCSRQALPSMASRPRGDQR